MMTANTMLSTNTLLYYGEHLVSYCLEGLALKHGFIFFCFGFFLVVFTLHWLQFYLHHSFSTTLIET